jgi:aryl-alcohol dehydrogenase-like predicted oxidoreductase
MNGDRLALGTVQFGLPYGIANQRGQVSGNEAALILETARANGIGTLDTASAYGTSESMLGEVGVSGWRVVTKLSAVPADCSDIRAWVKQSVNESRKRLKIERIAGVLLHRPMQLIEPCGKAIYRALQELKQSGEVEKIGFSIYSPVELDALWSEYSPDIVQAPFNVVDRRIFTSGWLAKMHAAGTEIHTRSVFLQGLLLMGETARPAKFRRWDKLWARWHSFLDENSLTPVRAALGFVLAHLQINRVVVGVDSVRHLTEICAATEHPFQGAPDCLAMDDDVLVNPSQWTSL